MPQRWRASEAIIMRARKLRATMTPAERVLWAQLRKQNIGARFRRQHPVGPFILDFFCPEIKLALEVDGDFHALPLQSQRDAARTEWLELHKEYRVLRFTNREVLEQIDAVLGRIAEVVTELRAQR